MLTTAISRMLIFIYAGGGGGGGKGEKLIMMEHTRESDNIFA